jgi:hypothetical protein
MGGRLLRPCASSPSSHLILSRAAEMTISYETDLKPAAVKALADVCYP